MATTGSEAKLKAGAVGLPGVVMQAVGHIGPTAGVITSLVFITSVAGVTSPIAFLIGGVICLGVAVCLTQLAKLGQIRKAERGYAAKPEARMPRS